MAPLKRGRRRLGLLADDHGEHLMVRMGHKSLLTCELKSMSDINGFLCPTLRQRGIPNGVGPSALMKKGAYSCRRLWPQTPQSSGL